MASRQPDEEEPLLRRSGRSGIETRTSLSGDRFYCGAPPVPERYRWEYTVIFCTCFICCLFFVAIPILALLITGDRTCDKSRLEGVKPPFDGQIMPPEPVMVEYYTDWCALYCLSSSHASPTRRTARRRDVATLTTGYQGSGAATCTHRPWHKTARRHTGHAALRVSAQVSVLEALRCVRWDAEQRFAGDESGLLLLHEHPQLSALRLLRGGCARLSRPTTRPLPGRTPRQP
jgi:hypothetical protein